MVFSYAKFTENLFDVAKQLTFKPKVNYPDPVKNLYLAPEALKDVRDIQRKDYRKQTIIIPEPRETGKELKPEQ